MQIIRVERIDVSDTAQAVIGNINLQGQGVEPAEARGPFRSQHQGDKWIAAVYAVSAFDILKSVSFEVNVTDMSPRATSNEAAPTADETIASIVPLRQPKKAKTDAARARAYRQRKRQKAKAAALAKLRISIFRITDTGGLLVGGFGICRTACHAACDRHVTRRGA